MKKILSGKIPTKIPTARHLASKTLICISLCLLSACTDPIVVESTLQEVKKEDQSAKEQHNFSHFENINVIGKIGDGVIAGKLSKLGANFGGTGSNNDSKILDTSTLSEADAVTFIKDNLTPGAYLIVDGGDNESSSVKINSIMMSALGFSMKNVVAYAIYKNMEGHEEITPLYSLFNKEGERNIDQTKSYFHNLTSQFDTNGKKS